MQKKKPIEAIEEIALKWAEKLGYELVEAAFEKEAPGVYLRIYIDVGRGITLDDCERYHTAVQPDLEPFEYDFLEVCSPGIDRPIKTERDARRVVGMEAEIRTYKPRDGRKVFTGVFTGLDDEGYHLRVGDKDMVFSKKETALARCTPDMEGIEEVYLTEREEQQ